MGHMVWKVFFEGISNPGAVYTKAKQGQWHFNMRMPGTIKQVNDQGCQPCSAWHLADANSST